MLKSLLTFILSSSLSAVLCGLRLLVFKPFRTKTNTDGVIFYEGEVVHSRNKPTKHFFRYTVKYIVVDVPEDGAAPASEYAARQLKAGVRMSATEARALCGIRGRGRVRALVLPESAGYEQNPICVYYCYDEAGEELECCIAEVTNTPWGDRVAFPFAATGDQLPKPLHVSPLQDMESSWGLRATAPAETLHVRVDVLAHPAFGNFFVAILDARALPGVDDPEWWAFFMPHKVALWIYWHAAVLLARKGLSFYGHPKSSGAAEDYREAPKRKSAEQGWKACPVLAGSPAGSRPMVWTDATQYPWT